jgi:hypothetical protein
LAVKPSQTLTFIKGNMMNPQMKMERILERARREGKLEKLQAAMSEVLSCFEEPSLTAREVPPGKLFKRPGKQGVYIRVTPAGELADNSHFMQDLIRREEVFVVNMDSDRKTFFFIKGCEEVELI